MPTDTQLQGLRVLVVDDEQNIRRTLSICLEGDGYQVSQAASFPEAEDHLQRQVFDVAFVDIRLKERNGLDLLPLFQELSPWTKVVVITAFASVDSAVEAMQRGAFDYLPKPFTPDQVRLTAAKAGKQRLLEKQVESLRSDLQSVQPDILLESANPEMQRVLATARQAAMSEAIIMLQGESGTGKTLLARAIHDWSRRAENGFGVVSCPSLTPELLQSELFGHVKGAFTGAVQDQAGKLDTLAGGTLFLDEVADLALPIQPKLLRFIQDRTYERLGDPTPRTADVRLVVATNLDLERAVQDGQFRQDLYYRLNVIPLTLPPLRERPEDILPLARHFLDFFKHANHKALDGFSKPAEHALQTHPWPGNLRELRNAIERAVILSTEGVISQQHLPSSSTSTSPAPSVAIGGDLSLAELEEEHIRRVLARTSSYQEAADCLGIDQATLWRRRRQYGL